MHESGETAVTQAMEDALRWMRTGHTLFQRALRGLDENGFSVESALPGWTRRHVVAHVAGNAHALANLAHWAATGIETPMYASPEARSAGIARGADMTSDQLHDWNNASTYKLVQRLEALTAEQLVRQVRTGHGRVIPATDIPWLRAREVMVHAVDMGTGVTFHDLPKDFVNALVADIAMTRGGVTLPPGPAPEIAAWLAGRSHVLEDAAVLGPWL